MRGWRDVVIITGNYSQFRVRLKNPLSQERRGCPIYFAPGRLSELSAGEELADLICNTVTGLDRVFDTGHRVTAASRVC